MTVRSFVIAALSMAKIGRANQINFNNPVIPKVGLKELDPINLPSSLAIFADTDVFIQWDYTADPIPPSKFIITGYTVDTDFIVYCSFSWLKNNGSFKVTQLRIQRGTVDMICKKHLDQITLQELHSFFRSRSDQYDQMVDFINNYYDLNSAQRHLLYNE
jgi:hypothetical protein